MTAIILSPTAFKPPVLTGREPKTLEACLAINRITMFLQAIVKETSGIMTEESFPYPNEEAMHLWRILKVKILDIHNNDLVKILTHYEGESNVK